MGDHRVDLADERRLQAFTRSLLRDLQALERMLEEGRFETGVRRIGAEQEMFLVDRAGRPAPVADAILERVDHPQITTELARFNLEANLAPRRFGGDCLRRMHEELDGLLERIAAGARDSDASVVLAGILPTLRREDLQLSNMSPQPRYKLLNDAIFEARGGSIQLHIKGVDELELTHDNVLLEACNTSFQIHFQVVPDEFARLYNVAQAITGPVLAAAVNSPLLLGRRLWEETRVALFQQAVDSRSQALSARGHRPRVSFGDRWVKESVLEIFRDDVARFRVVIATACDEDPIAVLAGGGVPKLSALRLHNGTVYRWNRPCYGTCDGEAHLRIEGRALPAGPTVHDEMANAALFFGLMAGVVDTLPPIHTAMEFDHAKENFVSAARRGLRSTMTWVGGRDWPTDRLLLDELLPLARHGLGLANIDAADVDTYLGILEDRVRAGRTGAQWVHLSLAEMGDRGTADQRHRALVRGTLTRQSTGDPVHLWPPATLSEVGDWRISYRTVGQFMTTDLFTVRPHDIVDLAASLMDWEHIRHVPVEDDEGRLVGLVSHRGLLRLVGRGMHRGDQEPIEVSRVMTEDPVTVAPDTPTLEAIEHMRRHKVGCLPVVDGDRLVGIVTERDLIEVTASLLEEHLREGGA